MQGRTLAVGDQVAAESPSADAIRAELERVLASADLPASERRRAFLRYVVEETLAGRADRLKGYTVALAVFGRDESFDAQADPVVRLEARRLRRDLDSYYVAAGSRDPVRITIPKGSYVPHFELLERPAAPGPVQAEPAPAAPAAPAVPAAQAELPEPADGEALPGRAAFAQDLPAAAAVPLEAAPSAPAAAWTLRVLLCLLAAVVVAAVAVFGTSGLRPAGGTTEAAGLRTGPEASAVAVSPFVPLSSGDQTRYLAAGISHELIGELMRFPSFRLYTVPIGAGLGAGAGGTSPARNFGYVIRGTVQEEEDRVRVSAQLVEGGTGEVVWAQNYDRPVTPEALIGMQSDLAGEIATALAAPYGAVSRDIGRRMEGVNVSNVSSYVCVLRAYTYRRSFSAQEFGPVRACLRDAVVRDPRYSDAWAMLGWLELDAGRYEFGGTAADVQARYARALEAASRAAELDPDNVLALKALASINHYMGRYEEGERLARRAAELNPHDPDTLAQLGWRLAVRGNFEEGIPLLHRAIDRTVNPPGWYYHLITIDLYLRGEYTGMLRMAERSTTSGIGISQALMAVAAGALGERDIARAALAEMAQYAPLARDPGAYFARHGATPEIIAALLEGLERARQVAGRS